MGSTRPEGFLRGYRSQHPRGLHAEVWRGAHPEGSFEQWSQGARSHLLQCLNYDPNLPDLRSEVLKVERREGFVAEMVAFQTALWSRVEGWFLRPEGPGPFPAIVCLHSWGGPMPLGRDRVVSRGKDHPRLREFLSNYGGVSSRKILPGRVTRCLPSMRTILEIASRGGRGSPRHAKSLGFLHAWTLWIFRWKSSMRWMPKPKNWFSMAFVILTGLVRPGPASIIGTIPDVWTILPRDRKLTLLASDVSVNR